jgi:hypothetical protein
MTTPRTETASSAAVDDRRAVDAMKLGQVSEIATKVSRSTLLCDEDDEVFVARSFGIVVIALNDDVVEAGLLQQEQ